MNYFDHLRDGVEFLIALGSIIGVLGFAVGLILLIWGGRRMRSQVFLLVVGSVVLLAVCGISTGFTYFRIFG